MDKYETIIGLEVHLQINTKSKIFCSCSTDFGYPPNVNTCVICTAQPGTLPLLNYKAIEAIIRTGLALHCSINTTSGFSRKQYFYPDIPKNYQITQFSTPLCEKGILQLIIHGRYKNINIQRIHLEEDAGKLLHKANYSLLDLNRAGIGLMELVTAPEISSADEALLFLTTLKEIVEYLETSQCNMEKGQMRCDVNISIKLRNTSSLGTKVEIKNLNSMSAIKAAINYESTRQINILENHGIVQQETRSWDPKLNETILTRPKENCLDYRYFQEPNLIPLNLPSTLINELSKALPELPHLRKQRFIKKYKLNIYDASYLTSTKMLADFYENAVHCSHNKHLSAKLLANWISTELANKLHVAKLDINKSPISSEHLSKLIDNIIVGKISWKIAKQIFDEMFKTSIDPEILIAKMNISQISDMTIITQLCDEAIQEKYQATVEVKSGNIKAIDAIIGTVMRKSNGRANPKLVNDIITKKLQVKK